MPIIRRHERQESLLLQHQLLLLLLLLQSKKTMIHQIPAHQVTVRVMKRMRSKLKLLTKSLDHQKAERLLKSLMKMEMKMKVKARANLKVKV